MLRNTMTTELGPPSMIPTETITVNICTALSKMELRHFVTYSGIWHTYYTQ